ncbi:M48 family metalloprotease [Lysobacter sp. S4-A87]|uniref:M56 family metallopeptidase n=1 Tax=Lysobacter sp. S4-A87 TaxID=2925843 RepID=UPI001F537613|nr:M56 family metallopeptidase [Lysobacter sp. S4-A87]UNK49539.1 M48 family metalloprotease [Lysobacter sp. S4-A87]
MPDPTVLVPLLGRALLHFVWEGALIGLVAALALQWMHAARPQARYAVACVALLACALVPAIHLAMMLAAVEATAPVAAIGASMHLAAADATGPAGLSAWPGRIDAAMPWIVLVWSAGACTLSLRMATGLLWIQRLRSLPQSGAHATWQARLDSLAVHFGLRTPVALRLVDSLDSPASAGWLRPVVLLPSALLTRMPVDLIEALLAHELAHIRRHDYLVNLLQGVIEALLFYHPVTWWLSRRIRIEREHIADQLAAEVTGAPRRLALALSELSELSHLDRAPCAHPHLAQAAHGGHLMSRIEQLVRPGRRAASGRVAFPLIGLAAACLAFYAHAQIKNGDAPAKATASQPAAATAPASKSAQASSSTGQTLRLRSGSTRDAYALISQDRDGVTMSGSTDDLPQIEAARHSLQGDFVWFRRGGKSFVIVDAATVAKANEAWRDSARLGKQMEVLGDQMGVHGDKMSALGDQMEKLSERSSPTPAMDAATRKMEVLAQQQTELGTRQAKLAADMVNASEADMEKLSIKMDALSDQQDALAQQMEDQSKVMDAESRRLDANAGPMEALSRQMEEASKPMEALSAQMEVLGAQHEKVAAKAEAETRKLISDAIAKGLALPAPAYSAQ